MLHELKIKKAFYDAIISGLKTFEIRLNDRGFQKGDLIQFKVESSNFTYHTVDELYEIMYVMSGYGLKEDYVALAIRPYKPDEDKAKDPWEED